MSYSQDGNIRTSNNFGNSFNPIAPVGPITKEVSKPFYLKKPVTSHDFSTLCLHIKKKIWVGSIAFDLITSA